MLRRDPTAITLSVQDVNDYDERRRRREAQAAREAAGQDGSSVEGFPDEELPEAQPIDPNDELKPLPVERNRRYNNTTATPSASGAAGNSRMRTQDQRVGLSR